MYTKLSDACYKALADRSLKPMLDFYTAYTPEEIKTFAGELAKERAKIEASEELQAIPGITQALAVATRVIDLWYAIYELLKATGAVDDSR